jgi:hypothetical protein
VEDLSERRHGGIRRAAVELEALSMDIELTLSS